MVRNSQRDHRDIRYLNPTIHLSSKFSRNLPIDPINDLTFDNPSDHYDSRWGDIPFSGICDRLDELKDLFSTLDIRVNEHDVVRASYLPEC